MQPEKKFQILDLDEIKKKRQEKTNMMITLSGQRVKEKSRKLSVIIVKKKNEILNGLLMKFKMQNSKN